MQELFISYLTQQTLKKCQHKKDLNYNDLSHFVQEEEKLEFLHQIVPKKITVKEFRDILERGSESESSDSEEDASSESESDEEVEEEEDEDGEVFFCFKCLLYYDSHNTFLLMCFFQMTKKW